MRENFSVSLSLFAYSSLSLSTRRVILLPFFPWLERDRIKSADYQRQRVSLDFWSSPSASKLNAKSLRTHMKIVFCHQNLMSSSSRLWLWLLSLNRMVLPSRHSLVKREIAGELFDLWHTEIRGEIIASVVKHLHFLPGRAKERKIDVEWGNEMTLFTSDCQSSLSMSGCLSHRELLFFLSTDGRKMWCCEKKRDWWPIHHWSVLRLSFRQLLSYSHTRHHTRDTLESLSPHHFPLISFEEKRRVSPVHSSSSFPIRTTRMRKDLKQIGPLEVCLQRNLCVFHLLSDILLLLSFNSR